MKGERAMRERTRIDGPISEKCLITQEEGMFFTGMGRKTFRDYADEIGATRHIGRRLLFHRETIEEALRKG